MVTTRPPKTIVKPTALGPVANTDTKLLIYGLFQKGRVLAQDAHQGSVDDAHLARYLNEFVFRFNRRRSRSRGMVFYRVLELAVAHDPVRYQDLIATKRPRAVLPTPPQARGHPPSLERPPANRPWRTTGLDSSG